MSLIILVSSSNGLGTLIKAGTPVGGNPTDTPMSIADAPVAFASTVKAWKAPARTFEFLEELTRGGERVPLTKQTTTQDTRAPLSARQGDCLYDTNSLFAYDGSRSRRQVAFVLWNFKVQPTSGDSGEGRLMLGAAVPSGDLYWEIIFPPDSTTADPSFGSWSGGRGRHLLRN